MVSTANSFHIYATPVNISSISTEIFATQRFLRQLLRTLCVSPHYIFPPIKLYAEIPKTCIKTEVGIWDQNT